MFRAYHPSLTGLLLILSPLVAQAGYVTVADYQFNPATPGGGVLADSSGNGNTLANNGNTTFGFDATSGNFYAAFNGVDALLHTVSNLDLSSYSKIQVSFSVEVTNQAVGIVFEDTPDVNANAGAFVFATSTDGTTTGRADLNVTSASPGGGLNITRFTQANGGATPVFDNYVVTYDPTQSNPSNYISITRNGNPDVVNVAQNPTVAPGFTFADSVLNIGERPVNVAPFTGNLANLLIQGYSVPEPSSAVLGLLGLVALVGWCARRRRGSKS